MNAEKDDDEKLEDYAVDVRKLRGVHEHLVAKRSEIEVLIAEERKLGPVEAMSGPAYESLKSQVDRLLEEWENEKQNPVVALRDLWPSTSWRRSTSTSSKKSSMPRTNKSRRRRSIHSSTRCVDD